MAALDSNAMTYLIEALNWSGDPPLGQQRDTLIALGRSYFFLPHECCFHITPTVELEYNRIKDPNLRSLHVKWHSVTLASVHPQPTNTEIESRAAELAMHHSGLKDCRILAECELCGMNWLITADRPFRDRLQAHSDGVRLISPEDFWLSLNVAVGAAPNVVPSPDNPLFRTDWWNSSAA